MDKLKNLQPFKKGQSGNPSGRPKGIEDVRALARLHTATAIKTLGDICTKGKNESARATAAEALLNRGWGKPLQQIEVKRTPLDELDPAELAALAAALENLAGEAGGPPGGNPGPAIEGEARRIPPVH